MEQIDQVGTYRGDILEMGLGLTKANKYPQAVIRLKATEKYIDADDQLAHFGLAEPGWVSWAEFNETTLAYVVLFNDAQQFTEDTKLFNYDQLQAAIKWDGNEFDSLASGKYNGTNILFRMEEDEYDGKIRIRVNAIDDRDAPPVPQLRCVDANTIKELNSKLRMATKVKPVVATAKPAVKSAAKPVTKPVTKPATTPIEKLVARPAQSTPATKALESAFKSVIASQNAEAESEAPATPALVADEVPFGESVETDLEVTRMDAAWAFVCTNKGEHTDTEVEEAWITAAQAIGKADEASFTDEDWGTVQAQVMEVLKA